VSNNGETAIREAADRFSAVPEINTRIFADLDQKLPNETETVLSYVQRTYTTYIKILQVVGRLTNEELETLRATEQLVQEDDLKRSREADKPQVKGSASGFDAVHALTIMGKEGRHEWFRLGLKSREVSSEVFVHAMQETAVRLQLGSLLARSGQEQNDDNPIFRYAYFGHTLGLLPKAMVHFVISHYVTRVFQAKYENDPILGDLARDKDALHDVLSVGIRIMLARKNEYPEIVELAELWTKKRSEGGVQWHNDKYVDDNTQDPKQPFYDQAFGRDVKQKYYDTAEE